MQRGLWLSVYFLVLVLYAVFSYALTDPNLVLTGWAPYWQFQQWMWQTFFHHRPLLTGTYLLLISLATISWWQLCRQLQQASYRHVLLYSLGLALPLLFSYNALSHDVFNYLFNAKMVVVYQQDPHQRVALDFASDPWVRFMHNTHTPAPYGYGWTAFSVLPFLAGFGKFTLSWFIFRAMNLIAIALTFILLLKLAKGLRVRTSPSLFGLVFLHPLFLIEVVSNGHNDLWMLWPALAALTVLLHPRPRNWLIRVALSLLFLSFSITTKLATVVLLPLWFSAASISVPAAARFSWLPTSMRLTTERLTHLVILNLPFLASLLLFVPLLSGRSQWFHPWYLIWAMIWLPLVQVKWWRAWLLAFALSSLCRYLPWLWAGGFAGPVLFHQQLITWLGGVIAFTGWWGWHILAKNRDAHT